MANLTEPKVRHVKNIKRNRSSQKNKRQIIHTTLSSLCSTSLFAANEKPHDYKHDYKHFPPKTLPKRRFSQATLTQKVHLLPRVKPFSYALLCSPPGCENATTQGLGTMESRPVGRAGVSTVDMPAALHVACDSSCNIVRTVISLGLFTRGVLVFLGLNCVYILHSPNMYLGKVPTQAYQPWSSNTAHLPYVSSIPRALSSCKGSLEYWPASVRGRDSF